MQDDKKHSDGKVEKGGKKHSGGKVEKGGKEHSGDKVTRRVRKKTGKVQTVPSVPDAVSTSSKVNRRRKKKVKKITKKIKKKKVKKKSGGCGTGIVAAAAGPSSGSDAARPQEIHLRYLNSPDENAKVRKRCHSTAYHTERVYLEKNSSYSAEEIKQRAQIAASKCLDKWLEAKGLTR